MRKFVPIANRKPCESKIERDNRDWAVKHGWFVAKLERVSPNGFPDRFYARDGRVVLIEFKRDGGKLLPVQEERIKELKGAGVEVHVVSDEREARRILSD